jgi:micrococcal nuclease
MKRLLLPLFALAIVGSLPSTISRSVLAAAGIDCSHFTYQEEAQETFDVMREFPESVRSMDPDGNGVACEELVSRASRAHEGDTIPRGALRAEVDNGEALIEEAFDVRIQEENHPSNGRAIEVRLVGVDLPAMESPDRPIDCFGLEAFRKSWVLLSSHETVWIEQSSDPDKAEPFAGYIWFEGEKDLGPYLANELLVREGYAVPTGDAAKSKYGDRLVAARDAAKSEGLGLWGACGGPGVVMDPGGTGQIAVVEGTTDTVTDPISVGRGPIRFEASYSGTSNFVVRAFGPDGQPQLVFNEIGPYQGERVMTIEHAGSIVLEIRGIGSWSVSFHQI